MLFVRITIKGHTKLFQSVMASSIPIAPKAGFIKGAIIRKKMPNSVHPSILPASTKSFGSPSTNTRKIYLETLGYQIPICISELFQTSSSSTRLYTACLEPTLHSLEDEVKGWLPSRSLMT